MDWASKLLGHGTLDRLIADREIPWAGHYGEAYGLLSGMFMNKSAIDIHIKKNLNPAAV